MRLTIGTRGSKLALWQANWVKARLEALGHSASLEVIHTSGDKMPGVPLASAGSAKALFTKEIEEALLEGRIHLAVHSLKDLPVELPAGLAVAAVPERDDPRDVFVSREGGSFETFPQGSRVGTSSLRRSAQLRHRRPDLVVEPIRGNVDTRLRKLSEGRYDAIVLAAAGLNRLGWQSRITSYFSPQEMCPAIGQGAMAIEARAHFLESEDGVLGRALRSLEHGPTRLAITAERALLARVGGGCQVPLGAYAEAVGARIRLMAMVAEPDGSRLLRAQGEGDEPEALGQQLAEELLSKGAEEILKKVYGR